MKNLKILRSVHRFKPNDYRLTRRKFNNKSFWVIALPIAIVSLGIWHLSVSPLPAEANQAGYTDVDVQNEYYEDITSLAATGIFEGTECEEGQFCPDSALDKKTMLTWLIRSLDAEESLHWLDNRGWTHLDKDLQFDHTGSDASADALAKRMVMWALALGCRGITTDDCLDKPVTRKQVAPFLVLTFDMPAAESAGFTDIKKRNEYAEAINRLVATDVVQPCAGEPLKYCPEVVVSRAQMAGLLVRANAWQNSPVSTEPAPETSDADNNTEEPTDSGVALMPLGHPVPVIEPDEEEAEPAVEAPGIPTSISLSLQGQDGINVVWQAPAGGGQVENYQIRWRVAATNATWTYGSTLSAQTRNSTINSLQQDTTYEVAVEATNDSGSAISSPDEIFIPAPLPGKPRNVRVNSLSANQFVVNWKEPLIGGNNPSLRYLIQWREKHQDFGASRQQSVTPGSLTSAGTSPNRIFSLTLNEKNVYMVRVSAENSAGQAVAGETLVPTKSNRAYSLDGAGYSRGVSG